MDSREWTNTIVRYLTPQIDGVVRACCRRAQNITRTNTPGCRDGRGRRSIMFEEIIAFIVSLFDHPNQGEDTGHQSDGPH